MSEVTTDTAIEAVNSALNDVLPFSMDNDPVQQPELAPSESDAVWVWRSSSISYPSIRLIEGGRSVVCH